MSVLASTDKPPTHLRSMRFDDMDAMAYALHGNYVDFVPLRAGPFCGRFCEIHLRGFTLRRAIHSPVLMHGAARDDCVSLQATVQPVQGTIVDGDELNASSLAIITGGADFQAIYPVEQDRVTFFFHPQAFNALIDSYGARPFPQGSHWMLRPHKDQVGALVRAAAAMTDLAESLPNLFAVPGLGNAMKEECHSLLADVLCDSEARPEYPRQTRDKLRHVAEADEFLRAHIDRPIYTEELCAALHLSARTLHQSFAAVYGMSPHAYLKRRRLLLVHRVLRAGRGDCVMVKSIVLAHGFWHLGRFAHEYAAMFGEMPSETLGSGRIKMKESAA